MTTILGIKTNEGKEGVILAADTRFTISEGGELIREKQQTKLRARGHQWAMADAGFDDKFSQKFIAYLHSTKQDFWALMDLFYKDRARYPGIYELYGHARNVHRQLVRAKGEHEVALQTLFDIAKGERTTEDALEKDLASMIEVILSMEKDPVLQAIKTRHFVELEMLNRHHMQNPENEYSETVELLIATGRIPGETGVGLYRALATGQIVTTDNKKDLEYFCIGTGREAVGAYFEKEHFDTDPEIKGIKDKLDLKNIEYGNISLPVAKCLVVGAMIRANREDGNTGPFFDIVEVTEDGIQEYGPKIQEQIEEARKKAIYTQLFNFND